MKPRFQFRLRTLFVVVTVVAVVCGYASRVVRIVNERAATIESLSHHEEVTSVSVGYGETIRFDRWEIRIDTYRSSRLPWIRRVLGDRFVQLAGYYEGVPNEELSRVMSAFPEARILHLGGSGFDEMRPPLTDDD
jgi:hypothetical protein